MTEFLTWHDARDKCAEYGADLVSIKGEEEADFIKNQVQLCGYVCIFFSVLLILNARSDVMELFFTVMKPNYTFIAHLYLKANRDAA